MVPKHRQQFEYASSIEDGGGSSGGGGCDSTQYPGEKWDTLDVVIMGPPFRLISYVKQYVVSVHISMGVFSILFNGAISP